MLTGLLAPTSGVMRILGEDVSDSARALAVKRRIGVVPENLALFDNLTAREHLTFVGRMYLLAPDVIRKRCDELLTMMDLADEDKKLTLEFSHGMKKKAGAGRGADSESRPAVSRRAVRGRDAVASRVLRDTLKQVVARGATVFLTSHVLEIVERLCSDVGIIAHGKLVHQGSMDELRQTGSLEDKFIAGGRHRARPNRNSAGSRREERGIDELGSTENDPLASLTPHAQPVGEGRRHRRNHRRTRRHRDRRAVDLGPHRGRLGRHFAAARHVAERPDGDLVRPDRGVSVHLAHRPHQRLQRSESIDLQRLMHLPVALGQIFVINYAASHLR
jgi:ABC-2 type transport system ATP-binding protein